MAPTIAKPKGQRPIPFLPHTPDTLPALILTGICLAIPASAVGRDDDEQWQPPIEDLFKTELVFPQDQGELQLATYPTSRKGSEGSAFVLPIGMEYGITDSLQIEAEWDAYIDADTGPAQDSGSGHGNLQLGLMYSLINVGDRGIHVAAGFEYQFASGDRKFLESDLREDSQELYLIFAKDLQEGALSQLFIQAGVELQKNGSALSLIDAPDLDSEDANEDGPESHDPNVWFANIGGYMTRGDVVLSFEFNLSEDREERYATPGISYPVSDDFEVGIGVAVGLTREADDYQVIGKLLWEFGD